MSTSPNSFHNSSHNGYHNGDHGDFYKPSVTSQQQPLIHTVVEVRAPKRGAKACSNCRRGKNRCEYDGKEPSGPCRRCAQHGLECVFAPPASSGNGSDGGPSWSRRSVTENSRSAPNGSADTEQRMDELQSQVSGLAATQGQMQSTLSQILAALAPQPGRPQAMPGLGLAPRPAGTPTNSAPFGLTASHRSPSTGFSLDGFSPNTHAILNHVHQTGVMQTGLQGLTAVVSPQSDAVAASKVQHQARPTSWAANAALAANAPATGSMAPPPPRPNKRRAPELSAGYGSDDEQPANAGSSKFPKLPGFKPPPHRYAQYGLVAPSTAASSDGEDESEDTLPRSSLDAPIEALQALANAADQAAQESAAASHQPGFLSPPRVLQNRLTIRKRKRAEPTPRNAFPDVVTKGLVTEAEARELWDTFFSGCHYFVPCFDRTYDTYDTFVQRTPWSFNGLLAVAAKIRAGQGPLGQTFHRCLEEAQGIARSTLFGPVVRKEGVMACLILASWAQEGWLPCGHALRMGLDLHLHKALDTLHEPTAAPRSDADERNLVVSARIWLTVYLHDHMWVPWLRMSQFKLTSSSD